MSNCKLIKLSFYTALGVLLVSSMTACGGGSADQSAQSAQSAQSPVATQPTLLLAASTVSPNEKRIKSTQPATTTSTATATPAIATALMSVWMPTPGTSFQIQYTGTIDTRMKVKMFDVDAYDTSTTTIAAIKANGAKVICYFSAGSYENWRTDKNSFPASILGNTMDGWPDERWVDIRQLTVLRTIMGKRMDIAVQKGCDGVDPDNMDGYTNSTGFPLVAQDQINYNKMIAQEAHNRNLSVGLKNDIDQVKELAPYFDWAINEQCFQYKECGVYSAFTGLNKAVFGVEYNSDPAVFCPQANAANMDFLKKNLRLDAARVACR